MIIKQYIVLDNNRIFKEYENEDYSTVIVAEDGLVISSQEYCEFCEKRNLEIEIQNSV